MAHYSNPTFRRIDHRPHASLFLILSFKRRVESWKGIYTRFIKIYAIKKGDFFYRVGAWKFILYFWGGRFFQLPARRIAARIFSPEKRLGKKVEQSSFVETFLRQLDKTIYGRVFNCAIIFYALVFLVQATATAAQRPFRHEGKASGKEENPLLPQSSSAARSANKRRSHSLSPRERGEKRTSWHTGRATNR